MTQLTSLAWKEWRESRWVLIVGLGVFLILPLIGALEEKASYGHAGLVITPVLLPLGGVLAVFAAVAATCRDLRPGLEDFWRSRPVSPMPWLLAKYLVGLAVVLVACGIPMLVDLTLQPPRYNDVTDAANAARWMPFVWTALYSLAFLAGCTVRKIAPATMLSLAAMLLVYFVPILLPPLKWLGILWAVKASYDWPLNLRLLPFIAGMLGIAAISLVSSLVVVRQGWKVESGQKMVYWATGLSLLLLLGSAAYPISTNLPLLDTVELPASEVVQGIYTDGQRGLVVAWNVQTHSGLGIYPLKTTASRLELGPKIKVPDAPRGGSMSMTFGWQAERPQYLYVLYWIVGELGGWAYIIQPINVDNPNSLPPSQRVLETGADKGHVVTLYARGNRLYLRKNDQKSVIVMDISAPDYPKFVSTEKWESAPVSYPMHEKDGQLTLDFGYPAGFSQEEALALLSYNRPYMDGDMWCWAGAGSIAIYRRTSFAQHVLRFQEIGHCNVTPLEWVFGNPYPSDLHLKNGLAFSADVVLEDQFRMTVYDVHDAAHPRPVGHFGLPQLSHKSAMCIQPLPDGRAIIGQNKLYLIDKPNLSRE